jgi:ABC-type Fe3+-citrate transport system substrate-binding protein
LRKGLGIDKKRHTAVYNDLDHLAGTWDKKDYKEFVKNIEDFEKIDDKMWK